MTPIQTLLSAYVLARLVLLAINALTPLSGERGPTHDEPGRDSGRGADRTHSNSNPPIRGRNHG